MQVAVLKRALGDNLYCGDEYGFWRRGQKDILCVADGLGHGKHAAEAAKIAVGYVADHLLDPLPEIFAGCDRTLRNTRGVAMTVACINKDDQTLVCAGIGNTRAMVIGKKTVRLSSNYGIVGGGYKILSPETVTFAPGNLAILFTDGLAELFDLSEYSEEVCVDLQQLARRIFEDWHCGTDDAALLVYRNNSGDTILN